MSHLIFGSIMRSSETYDEHLRFFILFFLACTGFAILKVYPGYVHRDTEEIYMWSRLGFHMLYYKHPPLLPWIVGAVDHVVPANWIVLAIVAALNVTVAAYAVWRIACLTIGEPRACLAMSIYWLSPYAVWQAIKLDHNAILLSTWPLFIWAFIECLRKPQTVRGLLLGIVAAVTMYAKYTSALLLLAAGVAALLSNRRSQLFRSGAPYAAVAVFLVLIAPLAWSAFQNTGNVNYALHEDETLPLATLNMIVTNLLRMLPIFAGFGALYLWIGKRVDERAEYFLELLTLTAVPYALIVTANSCFNLRGSQAWTMPVLSLVPVLLVALLRAPTQRQQLILQRGSIALALVLPIGGLLVLGQAFLGGNSNMTDPTSELADKAAAIWRSSIKQPLGIVAGDDRIALTASYTLSDHPPAWPFFSQDLWWISKSVLDSRGVIAFCRSADTGCISTADKLLADRSGWTCSVDAQRLWFGMHGPHVNARAYFIPPRNAEFSPSCSATARI